MSGIARVAPAPLTIRRPPSCHNMLGRTGDRREQSAPADDHQPHGDVRSGGVLPDGDRPATSAVSASRSRPPITRSDDGIAPWGRWVILHLCATSRSWSGPAHRAAWTVVTQSSLSCRGDSRQPALPAPPCEPDRAVTFPGARRCRRARARRREWARGGGDHESADRIRAQIRAGGREPRDGPGRADSGRGDHAAHPTLDATRPVRSHRPALAHRQHRRIFPPLARLDAPIETGFGSAWTFPAMIERHSASAGAAT